ncbi:MAG: hypothetical protein EXS16_18130 [Gemmataceae bacterium]|nr:hypothetical protein [Gemmataceae bacterium]
MTHLVRSVLAVAVGLAIGILQAGEPAPLSADQIDKLHQLIKPQRGEARWMEIDWHPNIWEARQKAAREGKPMFIWAGSGGAPAAGC